jgi:hypothetical protein
VLQIALRVNGRDAHVVNAVINVLTGAVKKIEVMVFVFLISKNEDT